MGCSVYLPEVCVDFDYGPDGRLDGFDLWRLYMYACELPKKYKKYNDKDLLEREFNTYLIKGKAKRRPPAATPTSFTEICATTHF
ncbi:DUF6896 domain-containing protein [Pseudomonas trivialis]|uniref:DUF6896 domain-containing protein n=1 Tax=Pseudomonas trivialis TaxID=200450 RepID=UPI003BB224B6